MKEMAPEKNIALNYKILLKLDKRHQDVYPITQPKWDTASFFCWTKLILILIYLRSRDWSHQL